MNLYGGTTLLNAHIHAFIALAFVGSFSLAMALIIWQSAFGENPLANALAKTIAIQQTAGY